VPETARLPQKRAEGLYGGQARVIMFNAVKLPCHHDFDVRFVPKADMCNIDLKNA
jgi:hypothetical protein